jgi:low affinity Fe/Cu permease
VTGKQLDIIAGIFGLSFIPAILITRSKFVGFLVCVIAIIFWIASDKKKKEDEEEEYARRQSKNSYAFSKVEGFSSTQKYESPDKKQILSIDENSNRLCFVDFGKESKVYKYKEILQSEIIEDDVSVTKTSRGSQIGGAVIGGLLAGGVGSIIGGLSGESKTMDEVKKIELQIVVNDTKNPIVTVTFMDKPYTIEKSEDTYKNSYNTANHWQKLISVLIKQADEEDKKKEQTKFNRSTSSITEELTKLANLKKEGYLTKEEFDIQKEKLLG